jgi:hypothetical protein
MGPVVTIDVNSAVIDQIESAHSAVNSFTGNREVGGYLLGHNGRIVSAIAAGSDHRETSMRLDHPYTVGGHEAILGDFHTHGIDETNDGTPSRADLLSSAWSLFNIAREAWWFSVIATRAYFGGWHLHAYITRRYAGSDRSKTEPCGIALIP